MDILHFRNSRIVLTVLVLLLFAAYFVRNVEKFRPLLDINPLMLLAIGLANLAVIFVNGFFTKFILEPFGKYISISEAFYVSVISSIGNFFAPVGAGFVFRAIYLKKKFNFSYSHYVSILSGNYVFVFFVDAIIGLLALLMLKSHFNSQYITLLVVFLMVLVFSLLLSVIKIPSLEGSHFKNRYLTRMLKILHQITSGWNQLVSRRRLMFHLLSLTLLNFAITVLITWLIIKSLHFSVEPAALLLFAALGSMSLFINITPGNLGIKEAIYLFSSSILGFSTPQILLFALLDRGVLFLVLAGLWLWSSKLKVHGEM